VASSMAAVLNVGANDLVTADNQRERVTIKQIVLNEHPPASRDSIRGTEALLDSLEQGIGVLRGSEP
jgi:hypothetical protein